MQFVRPLKTSLNLYIVVSLASFAYLSQARLRQSDNYFAAAQLVLADPLHKLLLYNAIVCLAVLVYQATIALFYGEVRENEMMKIREKIGYKFIEIIYFLAFSRNSLGIQTFVCLNILLLMFVFHNIAIARAHEFVNTHSAATQKMVRLLAHFALMLFLNYELVSGTFFWLFSGDGGDSSGALFAYYCLIFSMSIVESAVGLAVHFYELYTESPIENSDILMVRIKFYINVPRHVLEILLSLLIGFQFQQYFIMAFCIIESAVELHRTRGYYYSMTKLIEKMKNLKEVGPEELDGEADRTCTVCMIEIRGGALMLPCKHIFHKECLRMWIIKNENHHCPKCKKSFDFEGTSGTQEKQDLRRRGDEIKRALEKIEKEDPLGFNHIRDTISLRGQADGDKKVELLIYAPEGHIGANIQGAGSSTLEPRDAVEEQIDVDQQPPQERKELKQRQQIGSIPFGLPTEAQYNRRRTDVRERDRIISINSKMISFMKIEPTRQLLFLPELQ